MHGHPNHMPFQKFFENFSKFFFQRDHASSVTPGVTRLTWLSKSHVFPKKFLKIFQNFFPKGSCKFCYSRSNKTCMVIQITCLFKKFFENFSKFFFQRDHPSLVTPGVTRLAWSSKSHAFSKKFSKF